MNESILLKEPLTDCGDLSSYKASFEFSGKKKRCTFTSFVGLDEGNGNGFAFKRFDDCTDLAQICYKHGHSDLECKPFQNNAFRYGNIYIRMAKDNPEQLKYCPKVAILENWERRSNTTYYLGMQKQVCTCEFLSSYFQRSRFSILSFEFMFIYTSWIFLKVF